MTLRNESKNVSFKLEATTWKITNVTLSWKTLTFDAVIWTWADQVMFYVQWTNWWVSDFHLYRPGYWSWDIFTKEFLEHTKNA